MNVTIIKPVNNVFIEEKPIIKRNVAAYARVSTEKDEQLSSYQSQVEYYTRMINNHQEWNFVGIYTDEGITGTSTKNRLGFKKMVSEALEGNIDLIITKSVSRFARNTVDSLTTIRLLKDHGTEVYFEKENIWTFDSKGELLITIMSSLAQEESRSISDNVKWGIRESMRQGKAYVPYKSFLGYDKNNNGKMVINEPEAKIVRYIYGLFLLGFSPHHICLILENKKIHTKKGNTSWYASTINSILKNEKYKGDALRQKTYTKDYLTKEKCKNKGEVEQYYIENHHPAIIDKYIFHKVEEEMKRRGKEDNKRSRDYIYSRKIVCGECHNNFGLVKWNIGLNSETTIWRCNQKYKRKKCNNGFIKEERINELFLNKMNNYLKKDLRWKMELKRIMTNYFNEYRKRKINHFIMKNAYLDELDERIFQTIVFKIIIYKDHQDILLNDGRII